MCHYSQHKFLLYLVSEAALQRCSYKKVFWKYAANVQLLCNFIEITLRHGCSPIKLLHFFRTSFPKNISRGLLLLVFIRHNPILSNIFSSHLNFRTCYFRAYPIWLKILFEKKKYIVTFSLFFIKYLLLLFMTQFSIRVGVYLLTQIINKPLFK